METEREPETAADDQTSSPLRGSLENNAEDAELHNMGGNIGPASDRTAAADAGAEEESDGLREAQANAVESGAVAVDSPPTGIGRDDPDDPAGGDTTRVRDA
jgi:hypothetical protein